MNQTLVNVRNNDMSAYLASVYAQPMLTAEQEHELAVRFHDHEDLDAARQLVLSHLRFVVKIARGFARLWNPLKRFGSRGQCRLDESCETF